MRPLRVTRHALVLALVALAGGGCATSYWGDRGRDAADIFTVSLGIGAGLKGRAGPVQVAAINSADLVGLRAGQWLANGNDIYDNAEMYFVLPIMLFPPPSGTRWVGVKPSRKAERVPWWKRTDMFGRETFKYGPRSEAAFRGKEIDARSPLPILAVDRSAPFYTQVELEGGLLFTARLGFNPGELLDFLLGWTTLDIYDDDLTREPDHRLPYQPLK